MSLFSFSTDNQIKQGLNAYLEEYKAIRAEIVSMLSSSYQVMNITITALAVQVSALPMILKWSKPYLLAITPFIFYALVWIQLRYAYAVYNMSNHIIKFIAPSVRELLNGYSRGAKYKFDDLLSWEAEGRVPNHPKFLWMYPLEFARYLVPLLTAFSVCVAYISIVIFRGNFECGIDVPLVIMNIILFLYTVYALFKIRVLLKR